MTLKVGQQVKLLDGTMAEVRSVGKAEDVLSMNRETGELSMTKGYYIMVRRPGKNRNERVGPIMESSGSEGVDNGK